MTADIQTKRAMDRMYRWTRHVYDASRKYYLLGRDHLIAHLEPQDGEHICEIGCGTARNLVTLAQRYPGTHFYGLDASDEMLKTAHKALRKAELENKVKIVQGYAQNFDLEACFGLTGPLDKIIFSYSLSIIPPWQESIDHALKRLKSGGEIHIIDFGEQEEWPRPFRTALFWWLKKFHVYYKPEILEYLKNLAAEQQGALEYESLYGGYAVRAVFTKA